ncbi:hypothetical protein BGZ76_004300 [Entomortierella beljakovae]|nr:hypothetical protein BGZ76_004300 [Entomortierella beljakovae]
MVLTKTYPDGSTPTIAIIGAGFAGLLTAIQLQRKLNLTSYTVFELQPDLGGTWLTSTYPACQADVPAHLYSFSFAPNYEFPDKFSQRSDVLTYIQSTAKTYNIYDKIRFQTKVSAIHWEEKCKKWTLHWINTSTNEEGDFEADFVFHGTGVLRVPSIPEEYSGFKGAMWHSANWDHSVDLSDKRVGVIGISESGVQVVSGIGRNVKSLEVYGRTPPYIKPRLNIAYNNVWLCLFYYVPFFYQIYRTFLYILEDATIFIYKRLTWRSVFHRMLYYAITWLYRFTSLVFRPDLRKKMTPKYEIGNRRIVLSDEFYPIIKLPHVSLHSSPIVSINGNTLETEDGSKQELDVLILATGYQRTGNFPNKFWFGRGGVEIVKHWDGDPRAYNAHHSLICLFEAQVEYAIQVLSFMMERNIGTLEVTQEALNGYDEYIDRKMKEMIFTNTSTPNYINSKAQ